MYSFVFSASMPMTFRTFAVGSAERKNGLHGGEPAQDSHLLPFSLTQFKMIA